MSKIGDDLRPDGVLDIREQQMRSFQHDQSAGFEVGWSFGFTGGEEAW